MILSRIEVYEKETLPVFEEFKKKKMAMIKFEPKRGVKDYPLLLDMIKKLNFLK